MLDWLKGKNEEKPGDGKKVSADKNTLGGRVKLGATILLYDADTEAPIWCGPVANVRTDSCVVEGSGHLPPGALLWFDSPQAGDRMNLMLASDGDARYVMTVELTEASAERMAMKAISGWERRQQRQHARVPVDDGFGVQIRVGGNVGERGRISIDLRDVSAGGLMLEGPYELEEGREYWARFSLPESEDEISVKLKIVRCQRKGHGNDETQPFNIGCTFARLTEDKREILSRWVFNRQVELRRAT